MSKLACGRPLPNMATAPSKKSIKDWSTAIRDYVSTHGLRQSSQRLSIAETIQKISGHFTIQDVVDRMHSHDGSIGAATVYRTIALLRDVGLLKETLVDEGGTTVFEVADESHHDHIVCVDCGHIFEFHDDRIEKIQRELGLKLKFSEARHRHVIYSKCQYLER